MSKFKKGDRVRLMDTPDGLITYAFQERGATGTVTEDYSSYPSVDWDQLCKNMTGRQYRAACNIKRLELIVEENATKEFNVGDRVRCIKDRAGFIKIGTLGGIRKVGPTCDGHSSFNVDWDDGRENWMMLDDELELVSYGEAIPVSDSSYTFESGVFHSLTRNTYLSDDYVIYFIDPDDREGMMFHEEDGFYSIVPLLPSETRYPTDYGRRVSEDDFTIFKGVASDIRVGDIFIDDSELHHPTPFDVHFTTAQDETTVLGNFLSDGISTYELDIEDDTDDYIILRPNV